MKRFLFLSLIALFLVALAAESASAGSGHRRHRGCRGKRTRVVPYEEIGYAGFFRRERDLERWRLFLHRREQQETSCAQGACAPAAVPVPAPVPAPVRTPVPDPIPAPK